MSRPKAEPSWRFDHADVMHLLKVMLKASGKKGAPQGGVISPLLSNLYLNEVDKMLERAREITRNGKYTHVEYARFADDLVVLIDAYKRHDWLIGAVTKRLREEFAKLQVEINDEKSRTVNLERGESFSFLGFDFCYLRSLRGAMRPHYTPPMFHIHKKRAHLLDDLRFGSLDHRRLFKAKRPFPTDREHRRRVQGFYRACDERPSRYRVSRPSNDESFPVIRRDRVERRFAKTIGCELDDAGSFRPPLTVCRRFRLGGVRKSSSAEGHCDAASCGRCNRPH
jgi:hypothetical protein